MQKKTNFMSNFTIYKYHIDVKRSDYYDIKIYLHKNTSYKIEFGKTRFNIKCIYEGDDIFKNRMNSKYDVLFKVRYSDIYTIRLVPYENYTGEVVIKSYKLINDVCDKVYVINLDHCKNRYVLLENMLNKNFIKTERFSGTDGYDRKYNSLWNTILKKPMEEEEKILGRRFINSKGALGYLLSMKAIFEEAIEKRYEYIAVLDDDVMLIKDEFIEKQAELFFRLPQFKILRFGSSQREFDKVNVLDGYYVADKNSNGSFFNVYRKDTFKTILENINRFDKPFDMCIQNIDNDYCAYPNLAIADLDKISSISKKSRSLDYSKFRWNPQNYIKIDNFLYQEIFKIKNHSSRSKIYIGIVTTDRVEYFKICFSSIINSIDTDIYYTIVISNGTTDEYIDKKYDEIFNNIDIPKNVNFSVFKNNLKYIYYQSNLIMYHSKKIDYELGFIINDDITVEKGWDINYYQTVKIVGYDHLCFKFNNEETEFIDNITKTNGSILKYNGVLLTFTKEIVDKVGYFDEDSFKIRGHSHNDFSLRCCKAGFNNEDRFIDYADSNRFIKSIDTINYTEALENVNTYERFLYFVDKYEQNRRSKIINSYRPYISSIFETHSQFI